MKGMVNRKIVATAVGLMMTVAIPVTGFAADTIKFGVVGPHSGDLAPYGIPSVNAAEVVAEKINAAGGINGKKIELLIEDTACDSKTATDVATKLVSDGAQVVLGGICSGSTKAALPIYLDAGILVMSPSATNPALTQSGDYPNFHRTIAPDDAQAALDVEFAVEKLGLRKLAVVHDKGDYGKGFAEFAKMFIEKGGKAEVVLFEGITPGALDYAAIVNKVKKSGAEALIYGGYHPEASKIVGTMKKKRVKIPFISDDGVQGKAFIDLAKENSEGVYASGPKDTSNNPLDKLAKEEHQAKYNAAPGQFYENAYTAMLAMSNAIEKAGSTDLDALKAVLQKEKVETTIGEISFDEKGDAIGAGFSVYQVQNGVFVELN